MKLIRALVCIVLGLLLVFPAIAERELWVCPSCGRTGNTGNFCGTCGAPAPASDENNQFVPGKTVVFGVYEQDNNLRNGRESIEWQVLAVADGKALLLSKYVLDAGRYHRKREDITWNESSLRKWLNEDFLTTAFIAEEQAAILQTTVNNREGNPRWKGKGGTDTKDKVFLLSWKEAAEKYFKDDEDRSCEPTPFAVAQGVLQSKSGKCWWWLRSPGDNNQNASYVRNRGKISYNYYTYLLFGIRPAIWVNLNSDFF